MHTYKQINVYDVNILIDIIGSTNFKWISESLTIFILLRFYHEYHYITSLDDNRRSHLCRKRSAD
jgi:hypothetical protein